MLEDTPLLTGWTVISEENGRKLESATIDMLGRAEKVNVNKENTTIVNGSRHQGGYRRTCGPDQGSDRHNHQ